MEQFTGMKMMMNLIQLPSYEIQLNTTKRIENFVSIIPIKCYELLRRNLHVVDCNTRNGDFRQNFSSRYSSRRLLFQVKPLLDGIRSNYLRLEQEQNQSINEQIILPRPNVEGYDSTCLKRFTNGSSKTSSELVSRVSPKTFLFILVPIHSGEHDAAVKTQPCV